jgi:hypothetical protein
MHYRGWHIFSLTTLLIKVFVRPHAQVILVEYNFVGVVQDEKQLVCLEPDVGQVAVELSFLVLHTENRDLFVIIAEQVVAFNPSFGPLGDGD